MSENLTVESSDKPSGGAARLSGVHAIAAAAPVLFAPFGATFLSLNGAPAFLAAIAALSADFDTDRARCEQVTLQAWQERGVWQRFKEYIGRLLSPQA